MPRRNKKIKWRKHTNKTGLRQLKNYQHKKFIRNLAKQLGIQYGRDK